MKNVLTLSISSILLSSQALASGFSFHYDFSNILNPQAPEMIYASVQFDQKSMKCMIDTGARFTIANDATLPGNKKVGEVKGGGVSGQERVADLVESKVQIGDWSHSENVVGRTNQIPADCLIGNDFFLDRTLFINFANRTFSDDKVFLGTTFPLQIYRSDRGGHFGFQIDIDGNQISTLFDTGATDTVVDIDFVNAHPESFEFIREIDVQEGSNQTLKVGLYRLKSMEMGLLEEKDVQIYAVSLKYLQSKIPGIQAIIGLGQMMKHNWYIDNKKSLWGTY